VLFLKKTELSSLEDFPHITSILDINFGKISDVEVENILKIEKPIRGSFLLRLYPDSRTRRHIISFIDKSKALKHLELPTDLVTEIELTNFLRDQSYLEILCFKDDNKIHVVSKDKLLDKLAHMHIKNKRRAVSVTTPIPIPKQRPTLTMQNTISKSSPSLWKNIDLSLNFKKKNYHLHHHLQEIFLAGKGRQFLIVLWKNL